MSNPLSALPREVEIYFRITQCTQTAEVADRLGLPMTAGHAQLGALREAIQDFRTVTARSLAESGLAPAEWMTSLGPTPAVAVVEALDGELDGGYTEMCKKGLRLQRDMAAIVVTNELLLSLVLGFDNELNMPDEVKLVLEGKSLSAITPS